MYFERTTWRSKERLFYLRRSHFVVRNKTDKDVLLEAKFAKEDVFFYKKVRHMNFYRLFNKISPKLKMIARKHNGHGYFIDEDDLYQEMCIKLWNDFKDGLSSGINESYIIKGCEFHLLNYLRKKRRKVSILSLDEPVNDNGYTLKDILPEFNESIDNYTDRNIAIHYIKNNGFTKREKEVFSLLLKGYTVREAGKHLGISHVMVIKFKKNIIKKYQKNKI